mgnify:CR=1 FL=1
MSKFVVAILVFGIISTTAARPRIMTNVQFPRAIAAATINV